MLNLAEDLALPPTPAAKPVLARSIATVLLLAAQFIASLLLSAALAQRLVLLARIRHGGSVTAEEFRVSDFIIVGGSRLVLPLTIATAIAFLLWLYRVCENVRAYRGDTLTFTPGEAVRSFFIPIINLIVPYKTVRELWLASDPAVPPLSRIDTADRAGSGLVLCWWVLFLARNIPAWWVVVVGSTGSPQIEKLTSASYGLLASHLLSMPAALAAGALIYLVDQRQDALATAMRGSGEPQALELRR